MALISSANYSNSQNIESVFLKFKIGDEEFQESVPLFCPNETDAKNPHILVHNGHDTHHKDVPQQYKCNTCGRSFYISTSRFVTHLSRDLKNLIRETIQNGRITIPALSSRLHVKRSLASHLLGGILEHVSKYIQNHPNFQHKIRINSVLFVDETFITIGHKTWYLVVGVSGNNEIMGLKLTEHRDEKLLFDFIHDCASRLFFGLWLLVTDGLMAYKGVSKQLAFLYDHPLVHVSHIHKPNYHDIEMDYYEKTDTELKITRSTFWNDVFVKGGAFVAHVKQRSERLTKGFPGRKAGGHNRSKTVIEAEKIAKQEKPHKKGRPPGSTKKKDAGELNVFLYKEKVGCVEALWNSSEAVAAALNITLEQFAGLYITSNLVEKEFSVLKELLSFRGRRDVDRWFKLLTAYYALRDDPPLLEKVLKDLNILPTTIRHTMDSLITTKISGA